MMNKIHFTYKNGNCPYIDWLCESNKLILLSDTEMYNPETVSLIEDMLQIPAQDVLILQANKNITPFGLRKIMDVLGKISFENKRKTNELCTVYFFENKNVLYCVPHVIIPWWELCETMSEIKISLPYFKPSVQ